LRKYIHKNYILLIKNKIINSKTNFKFLFEIKYYYIFLD